MDTCIAIIMYCPRLFWLFIGKQHSLHKLFRGPTCNEVFVKNFMFGGITVLALQLFNKIERKEKKKKKMKKEKKKTKNMKKKVLLYFLDVISKYIYFS